MATPETFWTLFRDAAHWEFEIFLMILMDGVILGILWPFLRKHWKHHVDRDNQADVASADAWGYGLNQSQVRDLWPGQPSSELNGVFGVVIKPRENPDKPITGN